MSTTTIEPIEDTDIKSKILPPYHVIYLNDDFHSVEFVENVIRKVFGYPQEKAVKLTLQIHETGRAIIWTGAKEVAEFRMEQTKTFHEISQRNKKELGPIDCIIEPSA